MENALKGIETANYQLEFDTKGGETRYLLVNATSRRDTSGVVVGVVGVAQDVTETRKNDQAAQSVGKVFPVFVSFFKSLTTTHNHTSPLHHSSPHPTHPPSSNRPSAARRHGQCSYFRN